MFRERIIGRILAAALVAVAAVSCSEKPEPETPPVLTAVSTSLGPEAGSIFLSVSASGDWSISADFAGSGNWASVSPSSGSGSKNSIIFSYDANSSKDSRSVTLTLTSAGGKSELALTQKGAGGQDAASYGKDTATAKWLELPGTKAGDGFDWYAHDMRGGRYESAAVSGTRNYSFYYDYGSYLARWVAYPLNKALIGSGSRTDAWGFDPLMPADWQQTIVSGAYGTGHSRGHQLPSADRLTYSANVSTFYATNMTPQEYDFNGGIWANLEAKVRNYAMSSDTLYVVTGCVVDDQSGVLTDRGGHRVRIPSAYFKAVLRYLPNSTLGYGGYMACGYFMPHSSSIARGNIQDYIMSVKDLEKKTGIEFFVNLPGVVGNETADKIKSETPVSWWK